MAVIIKKQGEGDFYQRIDLKRCFINSNGLFVGTVVYKDKLERDKEKSRGPGITLFLENVITESERINSENLSVDEREAIIGDYMSDLLYCADHLRDIVQKTHYTSKFMQENPEFKEPERIKLSEKQLGIIERFGFKREWHTDPVLTIREDFIFVDEYKKQDFELGEFYRIFKEKILNSEGNPIAFEDDL
jgi:hypothetical protein